MAKEIKFSDIIDAFDFANFGSMGENQAWLDRETGKIYLCSDYDDEPIALPEDIDNDEKYIEIPSKRDLDLGQRLVFRFIDEYLPEQEDQVQRIFSRKGAYGRYKNLLEQHGMLDKWFEYETSSRQQALREWCEFNDIKIQG